MPAKPNFLLLIGEDAGRALGCYGDTDARTPNLDALAASGCRFDNAFSTAPVCAPSRCTLVTGQYAWSMGAHHMRTTLVQTPRVFTQDLRNNGYYVNWPSKTDFNFEPSPDFADDRTPWLQALRTGQLPSDKPFFLYRNFEVTHESTMWNEPWQDAGAVRERLQLRKKDTFRPDPRSVRVPVYLPDTPSVRQNIANFYEAVHLADTQIGEVLHALDQSPYRDNTIVIYLTDHGRGLAREKRWCYDAGIHLSLLIRAPGVTIPGTVETGMVSWVDIAPTILSLAGLAASPQYPGQAFLGMHKAFPRKYVFSGRDRMDEAYDRVRIVRNERWHYIRNYAPQLPYCQRIRYFEHMETTQALRELNAQGKLTEAQQLWMAPVKPSQELYDAQVDTDMVHNLAGESAHRQTLERMRKILDEELARYGDLGAVPERQLIEQGIVLNRLDNEYALWIKPLPHRYRIGPERTVIELP